MPPVRVIIYGAGAVGSVIGGRLRQGGADVVLVSRPAHVAAIRNAAWRCEPPRESTSSTSTRSTSIEELIAGA